MTPKDPRKNEKKERWHRLVRAVADCCLVKRKLKSWREEAGQFQVTLRTKKRKKLSRNSNSARHITTMCRYVKSVMVQLRKGGGWDTIPTMMDGILSLR